MDKLIQSSEFCQVVGVSQQTLNKWNKEGMPHFKGGRGTVLIDREAAVEWIKIHKRNDDHITFKDAAAIANVHWETLRYWRRTDPSFAVVVILDNKQRCISRQKFVEWLNRKSTEMRE